MAKINHERQLLKLIDSWQKYGRSHHNFSALPKNYRKNIKSKPKPKESKSLKEETHEIALLILEHIQKHGDYQNAVRLIKAISNRRTSDALKEWFSKYGKISQIEGKEIFKFEKEKNTDLEGAYNNPFWTFMKPAQARTFDLYQELSKISDKAQNIKFEPKTEDDRVPEDLLESLENILSFYKKRHNI